MTEVNLNFDSDTLEFHLVTLFEKLEVIRREKINEDATKKLPFQVELRTFVFWKSLIAESIASFVYTFLVCGANAASRMDRNTSSTNVIFFTALTSGFVMVFLTQFFAHVSGAHINPAVSIAMGAIKRISPLRTCMYVISQCGGAVAGAAFLYGVTIPAYHGYQENLSSVGHPTNIFTSSERFGIELILTFLVVFAYLISMDSYRKFIGTSAITIGATYCACSFFFTPYLNPARALGPSFVLNKWEAHWVDWCGPLLGGLACGFCYEYIFNPNRAKKAKKDPEEETSSIPSEDELNYDDLDKPQAPKFHGSTYNTYRSATGIEGNRGANYCPSLCSAPPTRFERVESIYGGTKSLCRSPPLTRANLNRSQSVYTKSNTAINRELLPKPGPLVPAQSLYPMRLNQPSHIQNQNVHNQLQQRSDQIYGVRGVTPGTTASNTYERQPARRENYTTTEPTYVTRTNPPSSSDSSENNPPPRRRPESVYALMGAQGRTIPQPKPSSSQYPENRTVVGGGGPSRPPPGNQNLGQNNFHQHSPNHQY